MFRGPGELAALVRGGELSASIRSEPKSFNRFAERDSATDHGPRRAISLPTAAVAIFDFPGDWPSLTPGHARLISLTTPADL